MVFIPVTHKWEQLSAHIIAHAYADHLFQYLVTKLRIAVLKIKINDFEDIVHRQYCIVLRRITTRHPSSMNCVLEARAIRDKNGLPSYGPSL